MSSFYSLGDVVLLNFPFSDLRKSKIRPAVILHNGTNNDYIVAKISSSEALNDSDLPISDWNEAGLITMSVVRMDKLITVNQSAIKGLIGNLKSADLKRLKDKFQFVYKKLIE
jgi:mRNA interferase MazF